MSKPKSSTSRLAESLMQRLDRDVESLADNFANIVKCAKIGDRWQNARMKFDIDVRTSNLIYASESLMKLIADLKVAALLHHFVSMNVDVRSQVQRLDKVRTESEQRLDVLAADVAHALGELESHYYASKYRSLPVPTALHIPMAAPPPSADLLGVGDDELEGQMADVPMEGVHGELGESAYHGSEFAGGGGEGLDSSFGGGEVGGSEVAGDGLVGGEGEGGGSIGGNVIQGQVDGAAPDSAGVSEAVGGGGAGGAAEDEVGVATAFQLEGGAPVGVSEGPAEEAVAQGASDLAGAGSGDPAGGSGGSDSAQAMEGVALTMGEEFLVPDPSLSLIASSAAAAEEAGVAQSGPTENAPAGLGTVGGGPDTVDQSHGSTDMVVDQLGSAAISAVQSQVEANPATGFDQSHSAGILLDQSETSMAGAEAPASQSEATFGQPGPALSQSEVFGTGVNVNIGTGVAVNVEGSTTGLEVPVSDSAADGESTFDTSDFLL